ncbi:MAG: galactose-1-phosphate uridylyltransferase [Candidatus Nealsonbacteria bacterium]|nr:galactose-1-phosphate uridylyltransferase [Candidatus Nealsonbacteria bacterium]
MSKNSKKKFPSELRFDSLSKDWVVIATGRARRPETFKKERRAKEKLVQEQCPFCKIDTQKKPTLIFVQGKKFSANKIPKEWTTIVVPNKYPAFIPYPKLEERKEGPFYEKMNAVGFHEVVVTRDHWKFLGQFKIEEVKEVFDVYQKRYQNLMDKNFVNYISIFHNHGLEAGASISHPHSQIITTPLIDIDLSKALNNSEKYYRKTKKCIYCQMNDWERKMKKRIVFENKYFLAFCPFASKSAFQVIVSPKVHLPYFEKVTEEEKWHLAEVFQKVLSKLYKGLSDPAYNFYLHTAPCDGKKYPYYHWHWTILPKTSTWAGFEIGTRMEISTIEPEKAAAYLRSQ